MRWLLFPALILPLAACSLLFPGQPLSAQRLDATAVTASATAGPTLIASAALSLPDGSWAPAEACRRASVAGNPNRGLICPVPSGGLMLTVTTAGAITFQIVDGLKPVSAPITIK